MYVTAVLRQAADGGGLDLALESVAIVSFGRKGGPGGATIGLHSGTSLDTGHTQSSLLSTDVIEDASVRRSDKAKLSTLESRLVDDCILQ